MVRYTPVDKFPKDRIAYSFKAKGGYSMLIPYSSRESEIYISSVLETVLEVVDKPELHGSLEYSMKELVMNASKANSKRVYFKARNLDINTQKHYEYGMKTFKKDIFDDFSQYADKHVELGCAVKIDFIIKDKNLFIRVLNNSIILPVEEKRVMMRLKNAAKFNNMAEVMSSGFDEIEGAGFGLIIVILMLRKVGLDERVFGITKGKNFTMTQMKIPLNLISPEHGDIIAREIAGEIEAMPQFPESVLRLRRHLNDPNSDFNSAAKIIKTDSSLSTEVLRMANSPLYMVPNKVEDIVQAVKLIGMNSLKNMVLTFGVNQVLEGRYKRSKIDKVMHHSFQVALYGSNFCKLKKFKALEDDVYVAALLHDFGKIIIDTLQPDLLEKLQKVCFEKGLTISRLEDLTDGYNHSIVGAQLAEKWHFPDKFVDCIRYHHVPLECSENYRAIVSILYLANELYYFNEGLRKYVDINYRALNFFSLTRQDEFEEMANQLGALVESAMLEYNT